MLNAYNKEKIEAQMEYALENGEFQIFLQPKVNMITSRVYGAEALSRWVHPVDGMRRPDQYIPIFEENGFIVKLDMFMFEEVCKIKQRWYQEDVDFAKIPISVNMSRLHLFRTDFVDDLLSYIDKYKVNPTEIEIEITESVYLNDNSDLIKTVDKLKGFGFGVSIDDFGSGYSSLSMLKDIPADVIKIDKEFLELSSNSERGKSVIKNIIRLCKDLKFKVLTEGVENEDQVEILTNYGCEVAQGFFFSKPISVKDFESYTKEHFVVSIDVTKFSFHDNLLSDGGRFEGEYTGEKLQFEEGIAPDIMAVHFTGGNATENLISLPTGIIHNDSYSVSMWVKTDVNNDWTATVFAEYENGFFQFCPMSEFGKACFRIRDRRQIDGWHDVLYDPLQENVWYHVMITYDSTFEIASLYLDGKLVSKIENVPALYFLKRLFIGGDIYKPTYKGSICEVIFYDRALNSEEIAELYTGYTTMNGFDDLKK